MAVSFSDHANPVIILLGDNVEPRKGVGDLLRVAGAYSFNLPLLVRAELF